MGVVHKLRPEVRDFILEQKQSNPTLSCRKLALSIEEKFQKKVSKSSINTVIKEAGLSVSRGRRPKKEKQHIAMPALPILLAENKPDGEVKAITEAKIPDSAVNQEPAAEKPEAAQQNEEERAKEAERTKEEEDQAKKAQEEAESKAEEERRKKEEAEVEAEAIRLEKEKWERLASQEAEKKAKEDYTQRPGIEGVIEALPEIKNSGLVLLEVADFLIGGSVKIAEIIQVSLGKKIPGAITNIKNLLYSSLLGPEKQEKVFSSLSPYLSDLKNLNSAWVQASSLIKDYLREARCAKIEFSDGNPVFIDSQLYSLWSTPHIPYDFSSTVYDTKNKLSSFFYENNPLIIFNAPGYDMPSKEFLRFLLSIDSQKANISGIRLYGNKLEELMALPLPTSGKRNFIFGLWPWQFSQYRKVDNIGEFRQLHLTCPKKDFYIADIGLTITHPETKEKIPLRGAALKTGLNEKTRLVILTNSPLELMSAEELSLKYLRDWPNLEEAFEDYNRKIELFTYTANAQRFFSSEALNLTPVVPVNMKSLLEVYLNALDLYARWHFMPAGYEEMDFIIARERFYSLSVELIPGEGFTECVFKPPAGYAFTKDLSYLCRRLNEKGFNFDGQGQAYFSIG